MGVPGFACERRLLRRVLFFLGSFRVGFSPNGVAAEKILMIGREEFRLTVWNVANIIVCTTILRRSKKLESAARSGCERPGWRQNIYLSPAVLFPHLARA